jgi:hypothetical protein
MLSLAIRHHTENLNKRKIAEMEIYTQETSQGLPSKFVLQIDKREARTLVEICEAAHKANKGKRTFGLWLKKIEEKLCCF